MTIAIFVFSLLGAMAIGIPIAFSLLICGVALMWHLNMFDAQILAQNLLEGANSFPLLAVPFFMLAGEIMNAGGLSRRIVNFAMACVGHIKGGLGYVTIMAAVIMAALSMSRPAEERGTGPLFPPMTDASQRRVVMPSPDLLYATCAFDVRQRPLRIQADPKLPGYWSIALYAANSDNFFVLNVYTLNRPNTFREIKYLELAKWFGCKPTATIFPNQRWI